MKKLIYFIIAVMFLSALPEISYAQSNDPFEQQTLKARGNTTQREKKIKRKNAEQEETRTVTATPKETTSASKEVVKNSEMSISNPCDEWLDVELISLIGSKSTQTLKLTIKMTNHGLNKKLYVGQEFLAYDNDGEEHARSYNGSENYNTLTDIPVKFFINVPGTINPSTNKVMPVMSFNIGDCRIEMRNVPINWK